MAVAVESGRGIHRRALGIGLEAFGDAAAYKGIVKYVLLFSVFALFRAFDNPVPDDAPLFTALEEDVPFHAGYPFAFLLRHMNAISLGQAIVEGVGVWAVGRIAVGVGQELRKNRV